MARENQAAGVSFYPNGTNLRPDWRGLACVRAPVWAALALAIVLGRLGDVSAADFMAGADCSHLRFFENHGVVYRKDGQERDALELLKGEGLNCIRLRLFTSTAAQAEADPYNRINNLEYTTALAVRVKQAGLKWLLDFHYSDTWADPGKQGKPAAWTNLAFADLERRMYEYNRETVAALRTAGACPDYVQIGNEITSGLLWPDGRVGGTSENPRQWGQLGRLLKAACRGVQDGADPLRPRTIIHIDRGGDWETTRWYFDHLQEEGVDFDIIGQSYYPFWHGTLDALRTCLQKTAERYAKPVAIVETTFPWTNSGNVANIPPTPAGQVRYLLELVKIVKNVPQELGAGIVWWGTEYQRVPGVRTAGFEDRSFFDAHGELLPAAAALGQAVAPVVLQADPSGASLRLRWPSSGADLVLATATNLVPPVDWKVTSVQVESLGAGWGTILPSARDSSRYYRLQSE